MGSLFSLISVMVVFFILAGAIFVATGSTSIALLAGLPFIFAANLIGLMPLVVTFVAAFLIILTFGVTFILEHL